ncbi:TetR/AcrR family transcriptional regulator [Cognatishimia sp. F0-27]|uniref:TetR/AcrR family transcriptional regulator n=1 Tax=Cognatishimia sp. F0-27 TaxID=2816855 RepID=UPI001D0CCF3A|nr:TetR/AcrR family transcriptional regulator [Cognatishimia sp. F0-27]MCC1494936.1 TetR/AcrR family transcriptional regulator [Cognatishimia sp. F0-27]
MTEAPPALSDKARTILDAAFSVFAQYGVKRTSMADIARACGMSRPALYQYFSNKDDIARSLTVLFYQKAARAVEEALSTEGTPAEILLRAFKAKGGGAMEVILRSRHGLELLDMRNGPAAKEARDGEIRLAALFAVWLNQARKRGAVRFEGCPSEMAHVVLQAHDGLKAPPFETFQSRQQQLALILGAGLSAEERGVLPHGADRAFPECGGERGMVEGRDGS